jgi:uncharacterized membrane protein YtjA (UPF0391 family)
MIRAAIVFFVLALLAYIFGAYGVAGLSADLGKILLFVFLGLAVISFITSLVTGSKGRYT